jgi:hypothetical protein
MKVYKCKVVVDADEHAEGNPGWHAYCPALENVGGATSGRTKKEASTIFVGASRRWNSITPFHAQ